MGYSPLVTPPPRRPSAVTGKARPLYNTAPLHSSMAQKGGLCDAHPLAWARAQSHLETAGQDPPHREKAGLDGAGRQGREKLLIQGARLKPLAAKSQRSSDRGS